MPKIKKECECCGTIFEVYPSVAERRKTCSTKCGYNIQRAEHRKLKPCAGCGKLTINPKYCSNSCQGDKRKKDKYDEHKEQYTKGELSSRSRLRIFVQERDGRSCCKCKLTEWMGKPITLWLDHISGNASDNTPENLRLVCPNCDSLSDTFGGKNRGNGRASHGLKPWQ